MNALRDAIAAARQRLPLPDLLAHLDLAAHAQRSARCPLHEDRSPSFSVFPGTHGWRWKCHAGCGEGDEIDFLEAHFRITRAAAIERFCELAGEPNSPPPRCAPGEWRSGGPDAEALTHCAQRQDDASTSATQHHVRPSGPHVPYSATTGTVADYEELAALRHISVFAPACAARLGTLLFGQVAGHRCWILTDARRLCAEARRMDGRNFPALGPTGERKAHTIRDSVKSWPVGLAVQGFAPTDFRAVLAVEGGPDYLAALHFTLAAESDCLPIAFLGAGSAGAIHPEALPLLAGRRVRFYPHSEPSGAGRRAVEKWSRQLAAVGCDLDAFDFAGLHRADGLPIKDLNDCTQLPPERLTAIQTLLLP